MQVAKKQKGWIGNMIKLHIKRRAVAMIELIFAIVIMGIALMSAPNLISQASMGSLSAVQQEAIAACATEMGMIMTRHWDEADTNESDFSPVLVVDENITDLNETIGADGNGTGRRVGTPQSSSRSFLTASGQRLDATAPDHLGADGGDLDDIDDFDEHNATLSLGVSTERTTTSSGDYIDASLQMNTSVGYISSPTGSYSLSSRKKNFDTPFSTTPANSTNVKYISTTITSSAHDSTLHTNITLKAFMCNIGTYDLKRRTF
jgi:hypothetical protein